MRILDCRRSKIAIVAIVCLTALGIITKLGIDSIAYAISFVAMGVAGANATQGVLPDIVKIFKKDGG